MSRLALVVVFALVGSCFGGITPYSDWAGRVVGGSDAALGQFPYQASIRTPANQHFCGGSIISSTWILCAAHCTQGRTPANTEVVVGILGRFEGTRLPISEIINHPEYGSISLDNDISLIRLAAPLTFGPNVAAVQLADQRITQGNAIVSGWGQTDHPGDAAEVLQFVSKPIIDNDACRAQHNAINALRVRDNNICAGGELGVGACMGDSGGPLTIGGIQEGVVSWGIACAQGVPDVYARVSSHRDWIRQNTGV
ncbi:chymotrypsin-2-like [Uranotaenia lowii]|uniref:chymotrypsin-2-like n=1 Tax=Uranotaenia lowii TaxID=190385 RepID=UPI002478D7EC|nr:chymotrypsin-2-like [Uranotaenia lowii]